MIDMRKAKNEPQMPVKILLIGASGVLGDRLYNDAIKKKWNLLGTFFTHKCEGLVCLDVRDKRGVEKIFNFFRPEVVILCGGITDVDICEVKPRLAEEVNIKGAVNIIRKAKEYESILVLVSTDYIFNGENGPYSEEEKPSPINVYGMTKLKAENAAREILKEYLIIRTAQLYGRDYRGKNFAVKMIRNMSENKKVYAAEDFYSTPTYVGSLSKIILMLIENERRGIYNGAGLEFIDRYRYVKTIASIFGLNPELIQKTRLKDLKLKARRPKRGGLKVDKLITEKITKFYDSNHDLELLKKDLNI